MECSQVRDTGCKTNAFTAGICHPDVYDGDMIILDTPCSSLTRMFCSLAQSKIVVQCGENWKGGTTATIGLL